MTDESRDPITAEDAGLPVLDSEGNQIGVVDRVEGDEVYVDPDADVSDDARASLGWVRDEQSVRPLARDLLERVPADDGETDGEELAVDLGDRNRRG